MQVVLAAVQVTEEVVQEGAHLLLKTRNYLRILDPRKTSALLVIHYHKSHYLFLYALSIALGICMTQSHICDQLKNENCNWFVHVWLGF